MVGKGFYPEEDAAVAEVIAAFEQKTDKQVELVQPLHVEHPSQIQATLATGTLPTSCRASATLPSAISPAGPTRIGAWNLGRPLVHEGAVGRGRIEAGHVAERA
jgi:hypothetical protein